MMPAKWEPVICSWWSCNWVLLHFNLIKSRTYRDAVARERRAVGRLHLSPIQNGRHCWEGHNPLKLRWQAQSIIQVSLGIRSKVSDFIVLIQCTYLVSRIAFDHPKTSRVFYQTLRRKKIMFGYSIMIPQVFYTKRNFIFNFTSIVL